MSDSNGTSGGIGLAGATFLVFLVLKLTGHIGWSWWWVTAPLWGSVALFVAIMLALLPILLVKIARDKRSVRGPRTPFEMWSDANRRR